MNLMERDEFVKASPAIQIQSKITHLQRRAWNVLLANAYDDLPNRDLHRIRVVELANSLGFNSRDYDHLKQTLDALVDCTVEWNVLGKDKEQVWGVASLLASAEIENGICTYGFAPHLRYKLYNPRIFTRLNLRLQNRFNSRCALVLWEVCFDYFDTHRNQGETPFIPLDKFKELIGLEEDEYPMFKILNRDVIKPAVKEINELTNYFVEVEQKRNGRKIGFLKFRISRLKALPEPEPTQESILFDIDDLPPVAIKLVQAGIARTEALKIANQEWDALDTKTVPEGYSDFQAYIEEKIGIAKQAADVKNIGGFIIKAIRDNYQDPVIQTQLQERKEKEQAAMLDSLESEIQEKKNAFLRQAVRSTPELLAQAAAKIHSHIVRNRLESYDSLQEAYRDGGMVTAEINAILAENFCADLLAPLQATYEDEKARILGT